MRKLLVSVACGALMAGPAAMAFAADDETTTNDPNGAPKGDSTFAKAAAQRPPGLERMRLSLADATDRVEDKHAAILELRQERREAAAEAAAAAAAEETAAAPAPTGASGAASSELQAIAECESGGDYTTNTGNGFYGAYQFTPETWAGVGGSGLPSEASPAEQDMRAQMLLEQSGTSPWPVCGG